MYHQYFDTELRHVLCTYAEALKKSHQRERVSIRPAVSLGTQEGLLEACRTEQPIGSGRIDEAGWRLYLPSVADSEGWNILGLDSLAFLCCHVDNGPHTR